MGDAGGFKVSGCPTLPEPIFESRAVYIKPTQFVYKIFNIFLFNIITCKITVKNEVNMVLDAILLNTSHYLGLRTSSPEPALRTGRKVNKKSQNIFLNQCYLQQTKFTLYRLLEGLCGTVTAGGIIGLVATASVVYSYVAIAALVSAYVLREYRLNSPTDLHRQAEEAIETGNPRKAISLIDQGGGLTPKSETHLIYTATESNCPSVVKHLLSLGFGNTQTAWNAPTLEIAEIYIDNLIPLDDKDRSYLVHTLAHLGMVYNSPSTNSTWLIGRLKVCALYYRSGAILKVDKLVCDLDTRPLKKLLKDSIAYKIENDPEWEETVKSLGEIQQKLFPPSSTSSSSSSSSSSS
jgi:hypothetical protein